MALHYLTFANMKANFFPIYYAPDIFYERLKMRVQMNQKFAKHSRKSSVNDWFALGLIELDSNSLK